MAIGDLVGTLVAVGGTATSFVLTNNPGGFFAISGSNLIEAVNTPDGIYPITIKAIGPGYQATTSFSLDFTGSQPIPPPGVFSLGVNISGAQNSFPSFPTPDAINYFVGKGFQKIRFPICWSITNSQGQTVGIQTAALGPLNPDYYTQIDTVLSTVAGAGAKCLLDLHNFGFGPSVNVMPQSDAMTVAPWFKTAIGVAQPTTTANAAINPFGTLTATRIVLPAVTTAGTQSALAIPIALTTVNTMEWSVFLMGAVGGESLYIMTTPDGVNYSRVRCTLTTSWQRFSFTGTSAAGVSNFFEIGADLRDSAQTAIAAQTVYASCGQLEFGSSATAYSAQGSYAVGSTQLPASSFADLWAKLSARYKGNPGLYGYDIMNEPINGFNSTDWFNACQAAINAIRANGDTTTIYIEGVNFSGGWNWVSGEGNPFNNANFYLLVDPANNLIFSAHGYFDHDASGNNFSYSIETSVPGLAPPGETVGPTIGVDRALREFIPWCQQHGLRPHWGEYATSSDFLAAGGNDNYQAWNVILKNFLDTCVANNIESTVWGGGFAPNYGFNLSPSNTLNNNTLDFTSAGLQSTQMVVLEQYTGYTGQQPIAYRIDLPVVVTPTADPEQPIVTIYPYSTVGNPSGNFTVRYNGLIPSGGVQITPYAHLTDDTPAGGTFIPATITLPPGQNAVAHFTYTPSVSATIKIGATNNAGWIDPPILGFSSIADDFVGLPAGSAGPVFDVRRRYTPYLGNWATLQRQSDLQTMTFGFNAQNNLPRQAIQDWAGSRIMNVVSVNNQFAPPGVVDLLTFSTVFHGNNTYTGPLPLLTLVNAAGYPEISMPTLGSNQGYLGEYNFASNLLTAMSVNARLNQTSTSTFFVNQQETTGPYFFDGSRFGIGDNNVHVPNQTVNNNLQTGVYHTYAGTVQSNTTNGMTTFRDGSIVNQANTAPFEFEPAFGHSDAELGFFKFAGPFVFAWFGSWTSLIFGNVAWTPTQIALFASDDAAYYSTPLPDSLTAVNPEVFGAAPNNVSTAINPFAGVTIRDTNSGSPTDSVTITLTGTAGGSLSGAGISGSGPYTIAAASAASITTTLRGAVYTTSGSPTQTETLTLLVTSSAGSSLSNSQTVLTLIPAQNPVIAGALATNVVTTSLPFWNIVITDPNPGATDSVTITLAGAAGGILSGSGITGTGPYSIAAGTPASVTATLQAARYDPAGSIGQTMTATVLVNSSAGTSATDSGTVVTIIDVAPAETPYAAPGGTFTPIGNMTGVNLSGAENGYPSSNQFNYFWPTAESLTYWAGKGFGIIRMPFWHRRLQQLSYGQLDPPAAVFTYPGVGSLVGRSDEPAQVYYGGVTVGEQTNLNAIKHIVDQAFSLGLYVIFDMHNFGFMTDTYSPTKATVGSVSSPLGTSFEIGAGVGGTESTAQFVDLWTRIATKFRNYPNVVWGLMNEPFVQTAAEWQAAAVQGINAIAGVTTAQTVLIPGTSFTGGHSWTTSGNAAAWAGYTPPAGLPVLFEIHEYLDSDFSGSHVVCVFGSAPMVNVTTWATANGFKVFIGETGWTQDSSCPPLATQLLNYLVANPTVYAGYTYWVGGNEQGYAPWNQPGTYAFSAVPAGYPSGPFTDAPQTTLMLSNII